MMSSRMNKEENDSLCSEIEDFFKLAVKTQGDLEDMTMTHNEVEYEIQRLQNTLHKYESTMETQRIDLGAYKSNLGRLEVKYDEFVTRESEIEATQSVILDLRSQIDHLNRDLNEAKSSTAKAEVEHDRIQLIFNDSARSVQLMQRDRDDIRAEVERLQAADAARDTEIARLRSKGAASQQTVDLLRRHLDSSTPFSREPPNLFRATSEPVREVCNLRQTSRATQLPTWGLQ
jgi:chromosome segregation ATPase